MCANVLRHTLDKVRYFRHLLVSEDTRIRILIGTDNLFHALDLALKDMKGVPVNQLAILGTHMNLTMPETATAKEPILIHVRRTYDTFVETLLEEYGDCEVIMFERDPTLD